MTDRPEIVKCRLILDLDVVKSPRFRELAPFREAVLAHFASPARRAELAALCEAVADQMLEREEEDAEPREPWAVAYLRAVLADLQHSRKALEEIVSALSENEAVSNGKGLARTVAALVRRLGRDLGDLERELGSGPDRISQV